MSNNPNLTLTEANEIIADQNEKLKLAGINGNSLIERVAYLDDQLNGIHMKHAKDLAELEQEKYGLERKAELLSKVNSELESNVADDKKIREVEIQQLKEHYELTYHTETEKLKQQVSELEDSLQQQQLKNVHNTEELEAKQKLISQLNNNLKSSKRTDSTSGEVNELKFECMELRQAMDQKDIENILLKQENEELMLQIDRQCRVERELREDKEYSEKQIAGYYKKLEQTREEMQEIQVELDLLKASDPKSKGNSLFAEVDDKRDAAEKRLINMKITYKKLLEKCKQQGKYICALKMQIGNLLHARISLTDQKRINGLREALEEARSTAEAQMKECVQLKEQIAEIKSSKTTEEESLNLDPLDEFYKQQLTQARSQVDELKVQLNRTELLLMMESRKIDRLLTKQHELEREVQRSDANIFKQQSEIDRLKLLCGEEIDIGRQKTVVKKITEDLSTRKENKHPYDPPKVDQETKITPQTVEKTSEVASSVAIPKTEEECRQM